MFSAYDIDRARAKEVRNRMYEESRNRMYEEGREMYEKGLSVLRENSRMCIEEENRVKSRMKEEELNIIRQMKEEEIQRLEVQNRKFQGWQDEQASLYYDQKSFAESAAKDMENCERIMREQKESADREVAKLICDDWKHIPINRVLIPQEINNIISMINNGFTFMEVSDYTETLIRQAREGELFRYNEIMREKSEMSSRHMQELGDYQPPHQSSAAHEGVDELPPMPLSLYERFKKERDSLFVDKENPAAVRKLSNGAE
jgi:hypothetical protein